MNQWSRTRKRIILAIVLFAVVVIVGVPLFFIFYSAPSCFDGKINGDETGIDCGGSCQKLCAPESLPLILEGDPRILTIATSTYEVVALLENPNADAEVRRARYIFKLFGSKSLIPLKVIEGTTFVPRGGIFAIFEGPFALEDGDIPVRASLEWDEASLVWQKTQRRVPELVVKETKLSRTDSSPRLESIIANLSLEEALNIDLIALLSDAQGNIFAASKTFIDTLPAGGEAQAIFTWPRPFVSEAVEIEIITRIFPDGSYVR